MNKTVILIGILLSLGVLVSCQKAQMPDIPHYPLTNNKDLTLTIASGGTLSVQTVDSDGDGFGDGLDFNNDGFADVLLRPGSDSAIGLDTDKNGTIEFLLTLDDNGNGKLSTAEGTEVTVVTSSGKPSGFDLNNDGTADFTITLSFTWKKLLDNDSTTTYRWSPRSGHQMVLYNEEFYLVGGYDGSYKDDVWKSIDGISWAHVTASAGFGGRSGHSASVANNNIVIYGGYNDSVIFKDGRYSNDGGNSWEHPFDYEEKYNHKAVGGTIVGGYGSGLSVFSFTSDLTGYVGTLSRIIPEIRAAHTLLKFNNILYLLGGENANGVYNNIWKMDPYWEFVIPYGVHWSARSFHASTVMDNKMWVMGGSNGTVFYKDVWYSRDGAHWIALPDAPWSARNNFQIIAKDSKIYLFGGARSDGTLLNDVWVLTK